MDAIIRFCRLRLAITNVVRVMLESDPFPQGLDVLEKGLFMFYQIIQRRCVAPARVSREKH